MMSSNNEERATLGNWRTSPYSRWAFQHIREVIPTAPISNDPSRVRAFDQRKSDVAAITYQDGDETKSVRRMLDETDNDAFVVLHKGDLVFEEYGNGMDATTLHILFSVSKSVTAMVAGIAVDQGKLNPDAVLTEYIPALSGTAFSDATVRNLLDMTTGIEFVEDYTATEGAIVRYRESSGWNPRDKTESGYHLKDFLLGVTDKEKPHGGQFRYLSPNTDMLGWIIEAATGERFADYMSNTLWKPMGASKDACITVDGVGAVRTAGGICMTAPDLAMFGQLILENGNRDGKQIIPSDWIMDTRTNGSVDEWNCGDYKDDYTDHPMRYRNKWYVTGEGDAALFAAGIHGQFLYIDPAHDFVCAKFSCQPDAVDTAKETSFLRACEAIARAL